MMEVRILCVGKLKEPFYRQAVQEYSKRLSRYAKLEIVEVADEPAPDHLSPAQVRQVLDREGERLLARLTGREIVVAMAVEGRRMDSLALARSLDRWGMEGGRVAFLIGGSHGLAEGVKRRADLLLSYSDFTLCHQLFRVAWLEQLYRGFKILRGESYHK